MCKRVIWVFSIIGCIVFNSIFAKSLPDDFVELKTFIPTIELDIRYYTSDNFVGE